MSFVCWTRDDADAILHTEALSGENALFLATHLLIEGFEVTGSAAADLTSATELDLRESLARRERRHAFCVVEGEQGSGKSHLIRWLKVTWPEPDDLVLLIQRLDGSLEGTLDQLGRALGDEHRQLFDRFATRNLALSLRGKAGQFYTNLVNALTIANLATPPPDADWCERHQLGTLLFQQKISDTWTAPRRIVELLSGERAERDQELARFTLRDSAELADLFRGLRGLPFRCERFARELQREIPQIAGISTEVQRDPAEQERLRAQLPYSFGLIDALNTRRNNAIQDVLGISQDGLRDLFNRLRRSLGKRRLVLLLEDITAWEGIDNQLIDVLVADAGTNPDLCPMISVVGLTPAYLNEQGFRANYLARITHHVRLGRGGDGGQIQEVTTLRTSDAQIAFAANYLRAARAGREGLLRWNGSPDPLPNRCDGCAQREPCHTAFGAYRNIGLYPFNRRAITNLYEALTANDRRSTHQTPRGMIRGVLAPTLLNPTELEADSYPGGKICSAYIPEERQRLSGIARDIIAAQPVDDRTRDRLGRLIRFWGSTEPAALHTVTDPDTGELIFAGIPRPLFEALDLPWPGDQAVAAPTAQQQTANIGPLTVSPHPIPVPEPKPTPKPVPETKPTSDSDTGGNRGTRAPSTRKSPPRGATLLRQIDQIGAWEHGENPAERNQLNSIAFAILDDLPWAQMGVPAWLRARLFTKEMVILEGTGQVRQHLVLPRAAWVARGLEAYAELKARGDELESAETERHHRSYATMQRCLKRLVVDHIDKRLPRLDDGNSWSVIGTATQILMARALLRGTVSPLADPSQQWHSLIKDEGEATSNPQERVPSWNEMLEKTKNGHATLRELLKQMINLPQGDQGGQSLVGPGDAARAILALRQNLKLSPFPTAVQGLGQQLAELGPLGRVAIEVQQRLPGIPHYERERWSAAATEIDASLRDLSIYDRCQLLETVIGAATERLPVSAPSTSEWQRALEKMRALGLLEAADMQAREPLESFLDAVRDGQVPPLDAPLAVLDWTLSAPILAIKAARDALRAGEDAAVKLRDFARHYVEQTGHGGSGLPTVQAAGQRIADSAKTALGHLGGES